MATAKPAVAPVDGKLVNCDPSTPGNLADPSKCTALLADVPAINTAAEPKPISERVSAADLLSKPLAVNLAYSSSATEELSILTA